jgi:hypothetical protein
MKRSWTKRRERGSEGGREGGVGGWKGEEHFYVGK